MGNREVATKKLADGKGVQLSGDSYLRQRKDGAEIFTITKQRHVSYWMGQAFPVLLVIRTSEGEVRWMEVRDRLKRARGPGQKPLKPGVFEGERSPDSRVTDSRGSVLSMLSTTCTTQGLSLSLHACYPAIKDNDDCFVQNRASPTSPNMQ